MALYFKRLKFNRVRRNKVTNRPIVSPNSFITLDTRLEKEVDGSVSSTLAKSFSEESFLSNWESQAAALYEDFENITAGSYAFLDAISFVEESIREKNIDANIEILDDKLKKEIEALLRMRFIFLYVDKLFSSEDSQEVKRFILTPKTQGGNSQLSKFEKNSWLKQLEEMKGMSREDLNKALKDAVDIGIKKSRGGSA